MHEKNCCHFVQHLKLMAASRQRKRSRVPLPAGRAARLMPTPPAAVLLREGLLAASRQRKREEKQSPHRRQPPVTFSGHQPEEPQPVEPRPQACSRLQSPADLRRRSGAASGGLDRLRELHLRDLPQLPRAAAGDYGVLRRRRVWPPRSCEAGRTPVRGGMRKAARHGRDPAVG